MPSVRVEGEAKMVSDFGFVTEWELQQSLERTQRLRPDLLKGEVAVCPKKEKTKGKK